MTKYFNTITTHHKTSDVAGILENLKFLRGKIYPWQLNSTFFDYK